MSKPILKNETQLATSNTASIAPNASSPTPSQSTSEGSTQISTDHHDDEVRRLAYAKWEAAGCPGSDGIEFWLAAEQELTGKCSDGS